MSTTAPSTALLDPLVERYLTQLRVEGGLATNTVEAYRRDLFRLQQHLLMHRLRMNDVVSSQVIRSLLAALKQESLATSSVARILSAMRGWYRFLVRERVLEGSPLRGVAVARRPVRLPKTLTRSEVTALLELPVSDAVPGAARFALGRARRNGPCRPTPRPTSPTPPPPAFFLSGPHWGRAVFQSEAAPK